MKRTYSLISTLLLVVIFFLSNKSFAKDYTHYATLTGHTFGSIKVAFSPDGSTLASGSGDHTVRLWDTTTGTHIQTLTGHTFGVVSISFSSDGRILASGSYREIRLWDAATGAHLQTLVGHTDTVWSISFSPDGRTLASGSSDKTIRLWDVTTGTHIQTLIGHTDDVFSVAFNPNGRTLASGSFDYTVRLWDVTTGTHIQTLIGHTSGISSVSFSSDGHTLASGSGDNTVRLWNAMTGTHLRTLTGHKNAVWNVSFSPNGYTLASGNGDSTIHLWNAMTGTHLQTLIGHTDTVWSVLFSPDGHTLASGSSDKTIRLWRVSTPQPTADQVYNNAIRSVMWIVNLGIGEGSGVLFDKRYRLAITNAHVTGIHNTIDVYFPAPDEKGELIKDRNFYLASKGVLKRLGYYTKGHVVARNEKTDLAIIRLDGLPETAREIDWNVTTPTTNTGDLVYILGNPVGQDLWRWTLGEFLKDHGDFLHLQSDVFGGNSGGPVLNKQGILIGIVARSDRHMNALAIPVRDVKRLLSESGLEHSRMRR